MDERTVVAKAAYESGRDHSRKRTGREIKRWEDADERVHQHWLARADFILAALARAKALRG
jgi:hypothetical protein